jgi:hypothetical protein
MSSQGSPRNFMAGLTPSPQSPPHVMPHFAGPESPLRPLPAMHPNFYQPTPQPTPWGTANLHALQAYPHAVAMPAANPRAPRFMGEENPWTEQEDRVLLDRKLSFDEVNILLSGRSERDIWERMYRLRQSEMTPQQEHQQRCNTEARIPGIESVRYGATR